MMYGSSTGIPPIQVRINMSATRVQNKSWLIGRKLSARCFAVCSTGTSIRTKIDDNRAKTPPNLLGIERRMAYANRKYHSGLIWGGVTSGFAGVKLSGSPNMLGENRASVVKPIIKAANPSKSLYEKYGWNEILSASELIPVGLLEPVSCRNRRWTSVAAATINGSKKWKAKNRVRVALSTEKPPQIHCTKSFPI